MVAGASRLTRMRMRTGGRTFPATATCQDVRRAVESQRHGRPCVSAVRPVAASRSCQGSLPRAALGEDACKARLHNLLRSVVVDVVRAQNVTAVQDQFDNAHRGQSGAVRVAVRGREPDGLARARLVCAAPVHLGLRAQLKTAEFIEEGLLRCSESSWLPSRWRGCLSRPRPPQARRRRSHRVARCASAGGRGVRARCRRVSMAPSRARQSVPAAQ